MEDFIQDHLEEIVKNEIEMMDPDDYEGGLKDEHGNLIDVDITSDDPKVLPWASFTDKTLASYEEYDPWRYPVIMKGIPFKDVWNGLERLPNPSNRCQQVLVHAAQLSGSVEIADAMESLGKLFGCDIHNNMNQTLLYIGSQDKEYLGKVLSRLDNVVSRMVSAPFLL